MAILLLTEELSKENGRQYSIPLYVPLRPALPTKVLLAANRPGNEWNLLEQSGISWIVTKLACNIVQSAVKDWKGGCRTDGIR